MNTPTISIVNFSSRLSDQEVQEAIRAVNRQVNEDFAPIWGSARDLRLHGASFDPADEDTLAKEPMRGESVIYLVDDATLAGALGYHSINSFGEPFSFVYTEFIDDWTVTLSHEVLELIIDPIVNILVPGPDPRNLDNTVLHAYEVCDAVERTSYFIDNVRVSNFVTPQYFTYPDEFGTRNDFLGVGVNDWVTYISERKSPYKRLDSRQRKFEYVRKDKPEEMFSKVLGRCQEKDKNLVNVKGISRNSRYKAALGKSTNG